MLIFCPCWGFNFLEDAGNFYANFSESFSKTWKTSMKGKAGFCCKLIQVATGGSWEKLKDRTQLEQLFHGLDEIILMEILHNFIGNIWQLERQGKFWTIFSSPKFSQKAFTLILKQIWRSTNFYKPLQMRTERENNWKWTKCKFKWKWNWKVKVSGITGDVEKVKSESAMIVQKREQERYRQLFSLLLWEWQLANKEMRMARLSK